MITVYQSDTGQYVLVHQQTQTVIIDDELEPAFQKMKRFIREHHPESAPSLMQPFDTPKERTTNAFGRAWAAAFVVLALAPFVWLFALHYSMNSLVSDFLAGQAREQEMAPWKAPLEQMRHEVEQIGVRVGELGRALPPAAGNAAK